jgi:hypothetical protein
MLAGTFVTHWISLGSLAVQISLKIENFENRRFLAFESSDPFWRLRLGKLSYGPESNYHVSGTYRAKLCRSNQVNRLSCGLAIPMKVKFFNHEKSSNFFLFHEKKHLSRGLTPVQCLHPGWLGCPLDYCRAFFCLKFFIRP